MSFKDYHNLRTLSSSILFLIISSISIFSQSSEWVNIGPTGGHIIDVKFSESSANVAYSLVDGGFIYRSDDYGENWEYSGYHESAKFIYVSRENKNHIYTANYLEETRGLYKSSDKGVNWEFLGFDDKNVKKIAVDYNNSNIIFAGVGDAGYPYDHYIYKSENGGGSWHEKIKFDYDVSAIELNADNPNIIYVGIQTQQTATDGFYYSVNGGDSWNSREITDEWDRVSQIISLPPEIYIQINAYPTLYYKSSNNGSTWGQINTPEGNHNDFAVNPKNSSILYLGHYKSIDGGSSWTDKSANTPANAINCLIINPENPDIILCAHWKTGIYRCSEAGENWNFSSNGINHIKTLIIEAHPNESQTLLLGSEGNKIFKTSNRGESWELSAEGPAQVSAISFDPNNPSNIWTGKGSVTLNSHYVYKSTDGGLNWNDIPYLSCAPSACNAIIKDIIIKSNNPNYVLVGVSSKGGTNGAALIAKTTDGGQSWSRSSYMAPYRLIADPNNSALVYMIRAKEIWKTNNFGSTWSEMNFPIQDFYMRGIDITSSSALYVASTNEIWRLEGNTWNSLMEMNGEEITCIAIDENYYPNTIYIGTNSGIFYSEDDGTSVKRLGENLDEIWIQSILLNDNYLYAATHNNSVWEYQIISSVDTSPALVNNYKLSQNYPNPFNPITTIKYSIPTDMRNEYQDVRMIVFDVLGREVGTLVNEKQRPGNYEVDFDGSLLTTGIYFYKLNAGEFIDTKKMILLK